MEKNKNVKRIERNPSCSIDSQPMKIVPKPINLHAWIFKSVFVAFFFSLDAASFLIFRWMLFFLLIYYINHYYLLLLVNKRARALTDKEQRKYFRKFFCVS